MPLLPPAAQKRCLFWASLPALPLLCSPLSPAAHPPAPPSSCLQLQEEVYEEAAKYGNVSGVYVAIPTAQVQDLMPGRCYVKYGSVEDATKGGLGAGVEWAGVLAMQQERGARGLGQQRQCCWTGC